MIAITSPLLLLVLASYCTVTAGFGWTHALSLDLPLDGLKCCGVRVYSQLTLALLACSSGLSRHRLVVACSIRMHPRVVLRIVACILFMPDLLQCWNCG